MPAQRKKNLSQKRKKKSLLSFLLVLIISLAIGLPIAYKLSANSSSEKVQGISSVSSSGELKISPAPCPIDSTIPCGIKNKGTNPIKPSVYLATETLIRGTCFPAFEKIEYTCTDGFFGISGSTNCVSSRMLVQTAETTCLKRGVSPIPSVKTPKTARSVKPARI